MITHCFTLRSTPEAIFAEAVCQTAFEDIISITPKLPVTPAVDAIMLVALCRIYVRGSR